MFVLLTCHMWDCGWAGSRQPSVSRLRCVQAAVTPFLTSLLQATFLWMLLTETGYDVCMQKQKKVIIYSDSLYSPLKIFIKSEIVFCTGIRQKTSCCTCLVFRVILITAPIITRTPSPGQRLAASSRVTSFLFSFGVTRSFELTDCSSGCCSGFGVFARNVTFYWTIELRHWSKWSSQISHGASW